MSDKENLERKLAAAESRWEAIQLTAANAQRELDYAIAVFEKHVDELPEEARVSTKAQIEAQKELIKNHLMKGLAAYNQDKVRLTAAIVRLEK
jgi:hypothetical protein